MPKLSEKKSKLTPRSKQFVKMMATPGMETTNAYRAMNLFNPKSGDPKNGVPDNHDHVKAYNKSKILRNHIEARKQQCLEMRNVSPEMVMGAVAMRAFGSIDGAFDENGMFNIQLARESGAIHLIRKLELKKDGTFRVEFYSNESAQQQLANYMGMEKAPAENDDVKSLRAGVEQAAKAIANELGTSVDHHVRMLAWNKVEQWVKDSRAGYSLSAINEVRRLYAGDAAGPFSTDSDDAGDSGAVDQLVIDVEATE